MNFKQISFNFSNELISLRKKYNLTHKDISIKLGFKNIYSYQRLEYKNANPSLKMIIKIMEIFPEFSIDSIFNKFKAD